MPATDPIDLDKRQRELETNVRNTAKAAPLQLDLLVAIERRLWGIQLGLWAVAVTLALVFFAGH